MAKESDDDGTEQNMKCGKDVDDDDDDDDNHFWLPIEREQDGQGVLFSPTPSLSSPVASTSTQLPPCEWSRAIQEYGVLLSNKASMDRRKFNKSILVLLNKVIHLAKVHLQQNTFALKWQNPEEAFGEYRHDLLNAKEMKSEELVERVVAYVNQGLPTLLTADERKEELEKKSIALLQDLSPQMSIKLAPIVKSYISRQFGCAIDDMLAEVCLPELSLRDKTAMYTRMINNFLDDPSCLSFALSNRQLLGNITPVDLWFLTFFAFVTVRRCRGDNLLMLGCVGKSSVGKSLLFESVVLVTGHQLLSSSSSTGGDSGVGRFQTGSKNTVSNIKT